MIPAELTEPEQLLCKAFPRRRVGGPWRVTGRVAAGRAGGGRIAALLRGAVPAEPGSTAGVQLRGAAVAETPLRLMGGAADWPRWPARAAISTTALTW